MCHTRIYVLHDDMVLLELVLNIKQIVTGGLNTILYSRVTLLTAW